MLSSRMCWAWLAASAMALGGCGGASQDEAQNGSGATAGDHDHEGGGGSDHEAPTSLADAVAELAELRDQLAAAYEAEDAAAADEAWHHMVEVNGLLPKLASTAELGRYEIADVESTGEELQEVLGALHPQHGPNAKLDAATYDEQAESLNEAIDTLQSLVTASQAATPPE